MARSLWRRPSACFLFLPPPSSWAGCFSWAFKNACESSANSTGHGRRSCEQGFALLTLCLLLSIFLLALAGTVRIVGLSQAKVAMQSRLDICALGLALGRKKHLEEIVQTNRLLQITVTGIYMARGAEILGGPVGKLFGKIGEEGLLAANRSLAAWQDARSLLQNAREWKRVVCSPTPFSSGPAFCSPPGDYLFRKSTLFRDVKGTLQVRAATSTLARFHCQGEKRAATILIQGKPDLSESHFTDAYEQ